VSAQTRLVNWSSVPFAPAAQLQQAMAAPGAPHPSVSSNGSARRAALLPPAMAAPGAPLPLSAPARTANFREPAPQTGFKRHLHAHALPTCQKCRWGRNQKDWLQATRVHAFCRKSWIEVKPVTAERWALGCWVCRLASHVQPCMAAGHFGNCGVRRPRKSQLVKHHKSGRHKRSVHRFLQLRGLEAAGDSVAAPSVDDFALLLQRIRRSEVEAPQRGSYRKYRTMAWWL